MEDRNRKVLTQDEVDFYFKKGYLKGYQIFDKEEIEENEFGFQDLCRQLEPGETPNLIKGWEKTSPFIFSIATDKRILNIVEDLIGPNILLWGTHFICKYPGDGTQVPWHQDARYWPLTPHETVTVWLAFDDCDADNSALLVIPGSHRLGLGAPDPGSPWGAAPSPRLRDTEFTADDAEVLDLKAGAISIHDDNVIHGSMPNNSTRRRVGLVMRFCTPEVKCDMRQWPGFRSTLVRGSDHLKLNPSWDPSDIYMAAS
ncbi:MAG TPA: phytanoyl-CoA dioxygenase family protein [Capsulimonadaceae bacterium]|jgi:ectoine hydroxylase-related dioxygenase (phytanoyl-CoA dioxygenase family)